MNFHPSALSCRLVLGSLLVFSGMGEVSAQDAEVEQRLAMRWAPVHYQDVDKTGTQGLGGKSDYITAFNFDGDWKLDNNWENCATSPALAHGYYSVVESMTHWFIVYAFYHPRDWKDDFEIETAHENDLEGLLVVVRKPTGAGEDPLGRCEAAVTVAHSDFYSYVPAGGTWADGPKRGDGRREDVDGVLRLEEVDGVKRIVTGQQARGHGIKADNQYPIEGGDGIRYLPSQEKAEEPRNPNDRAVHYKLLNLFAEGELWSRRDDPLVFAAPGVLKGDNEGKNKAHAPWRWDDKDDGADLQGGELATDPIKLVKFYFGNLGDFASTYVSNRYVVSPAVK